MPTAFEQLKMKSAQTGGSVAPTVSATPTSVSSGSAFEKLKSKGAVASTTRPQAQEGAGESFVKSLVEAPATIVARPFQAAQGVTQMVQDAPKINQYKTDADSINREQERLVAEMKRARAEGRDTTAIKAQIKALGDQLISRGQEIQPTLDRKVFSGGVVAEAPENFSDVVKDVGRGVQTVALGVGAPIAAGAAFGAGAALEHQGSDIFTPGGAVEGLVSTGVGAVGGKLLGLIGKPLLNASGKVVGTITPQIVKDVSEKGAQAVTQFMARHEIVPAAAKPVINAIPKVAEKVDEKANQLFSGAGNKVKSAIQSQYPNATKENIAKHYENIELDRLFEPTKVSGKTFNKSADVLNQANKQGVDLRRVAADNKIYASDYVNDGKFDTTAVADALASEAMSGGPQILRPALRAASPGVPRVPISTVRNEMLSRLSNVPDTKLSPAQKLKFAKRIAVEYGDDSAFAARYKNGLDLENLYDSKLQTSSSLYKTPKGGGAQSIADNLTSQQKQIESQVFDSLLAKSAPEELGLEAYMKAQQERFTLANYLRTLDGNKAPQTLFQRGVKRAAQLGGATTGASVAGPFGMFSGYQFGGILADTFGTASNPVKVAFLKSIGKTEPEIYAIMKEFVSKAELDKILRAKLPAPTTIFQGPTQGGKPFTPNPTGFKTTPVVETKRVPLKEIYKKKK